MNILFKNIYRLKTSYGAIFTLASAFFLTLHAAAFADPTSDYVAATSLGDLMCNGVVNAGAFGEIFQYAAYGIAAFLTVQGIHHMRLHADSPGNNPINRGLLPFMGAAFLLVLPTFIGTVINSIYGQPATAGSGSVCGTAAGGGTAVGLDGMLANFVGNIKDPMISLCSVIAAVVGMFMMIHGLVKASKYGFDARTNSMHSILTNILFGALLFTIGDNLNMVLNSVFGTDTVGSTVLSWSSTFTSALGAASTQFNTAVSAALMFIQVIGVIAFVRGWMVMKKVVEGGGNVTMAQGVTHIVGGALAINIATFLKIMDTTFGTGLLN